MSFKKIVKKVIILLVFIFLLASLGGLVLYTRYPLYYKEEIEKYATEYDIDPYFVASIINVESRFNKDAVSPKDAKGLMQITERTGQWAAENMEMEGYKDEDLFDPSTNIRIGTWYLNRLEKEFDAREDLVLAAYNGGSGNVNKWLAYEEYSKDGISLDKIPFKETENYLKRVKKNYEIYNRIYKDVNFKREEYDSVYINYIYKLKSYIGI